MAWPRFFVERLPVSGLVALDEDESRHVSSVLRMPIGGVCIAFDGCGGEALCSIAKLSKRSVELQVVERLDTDRELPKRIAIAVALPKGDRQKTLIDFMVQLGVDAFQPLVTTRGVAQPVESALVRLRRGVIESSKQCGRNRLMKILEPVDLGQLIRLPVADAASIRTSRPSESTNVSEVNIHNQTDAGSVGDGKHREHGEVPAHLRIFAHPYGDVTPLNQLPDKVRSAQSTTAAIGPEGGFTEEEADSMRSAGWIATSLGPRILRVEVAATHVASWLSEML